MKSRVSAATVLAAILPMGICSAYAQESNLAEELNNGDFLASGLIVDSPYQEISFWRACYLLDKNKVVLVWEWPIDPDQDDLIKDMCRRQGLSWDYQTKKISDRYCTVFSFPAQADPMDTLMDQLDYISELPFVAELDINY